jgi:branched-chain amino acid aminotransferase
MSAVVNVNGRIAAARDAVVSVFDHGFLYGEGVYETLRTYGRRPFLYDRHARRLRTSAELIHLPVPIADDVLLVRIEETMGAMGSGGEAYIRILLTRGVGELTYDPAACPTPTLVIIVKPYVEPAPAVFEKGIHIALSSILRNHPGSVNPIIKSNNLLNNALAMQEAYRQGAEEALMCNHRGELAECSQSNFFLVRGGAAVTPPLEAGLLAGITREFVLEVGRAAGIPVREETLYPADLERADEAFITGTTRELTPVVRVGDRTIGGGTPGPVTGALLEAFRRRARARTQLVPGRA